MWDGLQGVDPTSMMASRLDSNANTIVMACTTMISYSPALSAGRHFATRSRCYLARAQSGWEDGGGLNFSLPPRRPVIYAFLALRAAFIQRCIPGDSLEKYMYF